MASLRRPLEGLLGDEDAYLRLSVAGALGAIGDRDSVPALLPLLEDPDERARNAAARALRRIKDPGAVTALAAVAGDAGSDIRLEAAAAAEAADPARFQRRQEALSRSISTNVRGDDTLADIVADE